MGFIGVAFHQLLQAYALQLTSAVNTGWLIGLTPVWSAILAAIHLRERFPPRKLLGLTLGFLGAVLVVTRGQLGGGVLGLPTTRGDLMILASTVNWAVYTVVCHPTLKRLGSLVATTCAMIVGWVLLTRPVPLRAGLERLRAAGWRGLGFRPVPRHLLLGAGLSVVVRRPRAHRGLAGGGVPLPGAAGHAGRRRWYCWGRR